MKGNTKGNKIALVITLVLIAVLVGYNIAMKDVTNTPEQTAPVVLEDYDTSVQTLERLGFESIDDFDSLSDGSEQQDMYVATLKDVLVKMDEADTEEKMADAHLSVAVYLNQLGEVDAAIDQYEYYLSKRTDSTTARNNLGWIYVEQGDYGQAEKYFKENVELNPTFSNWYVNLADLYRSYIPEKTDEIPELFERGHELRPSDNGFILYLAEYYESEKEYEKALEWYQKALVLNPNIEYAQQAVAGIEQKLAQ